MNFNLVNENILSKEINVKSKEYNSIINIYQNVKEKLLKKIEGMKNILNAKMGYEVISKVTSRIKSSKSIMNKLAKKEIVPTYGNLVQNIKDISGIRIVCNFEDDIYIIKELIKKMHDLVILEEKDYLKNPKESGYRAYHLIVGVMIDNYHYVTVEIQIRTALMDFWASIEHEVKYKKKHALSIQDSYKLTMYAKAIQYLNLQMERLYRKQYQNS